MMAPLPKKYIRRQKKARGLNKLPRTLPRSLALAQTIRGRSKVAADRIRWPGEMVYRHRVAVYDEPRS